MRSHPAKLPVFKYRKTIPRHDPQATPPLRVGMRVQTKHPPCERGVVLVLLADGRLVVKLESQHTTCIYRPSMLIPADEDQADPDPSDDTEYDAESDDDQGDDDEAAPSNAPAPPGRSSRTRLM